MKSFKDAKGRQWNIEINVLSLRRVRDRLNIDLLDKLDKLLLQQLSTDPILLCDLLWVLVEPQAQAENVSDEEFGRSLIGDAIAHATDAFLEELVNFFPSQKRAILNNALKKVREMDKGMTAKAVELSEQLNDPQAIREINKTLDRIGKLFTNSQVLPESTPTPEPSAS